MKQTPKEILDTMLGYLGFVVEIEEMEGPVGTVLQIYTAESERLIGRQGALLKDLQYLLNRILQAQDRESPKVMVDVEHYRSMHEDAVVEKANAAAEQVRRTGRSVQLEPMNSYDRYIIHHLFKDDPDVASRSPSDDARVKRITLVRRPQAQN